MAVPIAIGIIAGVLFFGDFILSLSKDSFAQAKERTLRTKKNQDLKIKPLNAALFVFIDSSLIVLLN